MKIEQVGGFVPIWVPLTTYPSVVLYDDGRLITQGPQIEIYPGPALPNLQVTHLTEAGVGQVLQWAAEAGLEGEDRTLGEPVIDAPVTLFTVRNGDAVHQTSVTDISDSTPDIGAVRQFQDLMLNLRAYLPEDIVGDDVPYEFDRMRVVVYPADPQNMPEPDLASRLDWPLDQPLATLGQPFGGPDGYRCGVIDGQELRDLLPLLQQANELTIWQSDRQEFQMYVHPLLPDEWVCPGLL